jgi:hypothetical protein
MLEWIKRKWWLHSGIIVLLLLRSFVEPFKSNLLWTMAAAVLVGILIAVLMVAIGGHSTPSRN